MIINNYNNICYIYEIITYVLCETIYDQTMKYYKNARQKTNVDIHK